MSCKVINTLKCNQLINEELIEHSVLDIAYF